jgi:hypothetical protein
LSIAKNEKTLGDIGIWNLRCRATLGTSPTIGISTGANLNMLVRAYLATREVFQREEIKEQMENLKRVSRNLVAFLKRGRLTTS